MLFDPVLLVNSQQTYVYRVSEFFCRPRTALHISGGQTHTRGKQSPTCLCMFYNWYQVYSYYAHTLDFQEYVNVVPALVVRPEIVAKIAR